MLKINFFIATFFLAFDCLASAVSVGDLRCEHLKNPLGIDAVPPRLSWTISTDERDIQQTACQILVASSENKLKPGTADFWDSGKMTTNASVLVPYGGKRAVYGFNNLVDGPTAGKDATALKAKAVALAAQRGFRSSSGKA